jgi:hypothetical protein
MPSSRRKKRKPATTLATQIAWITRRYPGTIIANDGVAHTVIVIPTAQRKCQPNGANRGPRTWAVHPEVKQRYTAEQVRAIRADWEAGRGNMTSLARKYGGCAGSISKVVRGLSYRWVS